MEISFYKTMTLFSNNQQLTFIAFYEIVQLTFSGDHIPTHLKETVIIFWHILEIFWPF